MRKPRDYDAELKALDDKARRLRDRKLVQLGELVIATGADALPIELLAGVLLVAKATSDATAKEEWRQRGAAFFQRGKREAASRHDGDDVSLAARASGTKSSASSPGLL
jgi:DNA-binding protein H-NS